MNNPGELLQLTKNTADNPGGKLVEKAAPT
jgi:hypothetical protein